MQHTTLTALMIFGLMCSAGATAIVVPNQYANVDGDQNSGVLSTGQFGLAPELHYQEDYLASQFGTDSILISSLAFRPDGGDSLQANGQVKTYTIQVQLSTTSANPTNLSSTFADNFGSNTQTVYSGMLDFVTAAGSSPNPFGYAIAFTNPYAYDPTAGNLLLDIQITDSSGYIPALDFSDSSVTGVVYGPGNTVPTTGRTGTGGLVTEFDEIALPKPVPEPATLATMGLGFALMCGVTLRKRARR